MKYLRQLQDEKYTFIQNDTDLAAVLDCVGISPEYREDITGALVEVSDGEYGEVWLTESCAPYDLSASYYPLSFYR